MAKKKPRNPQDATIRNVRAARRRDDILVRRVRKLEAGLALLSASVAALAQVLGKGMK